MAGFKAGEEHSNLVQLSDHEHRRAHRGETLSITTAEPDLDVEVNQLTVELSAVQERLAFLHGAVDPSSLAGSILGLIGNNAEEMRIQVRPLRDALKRDGGEAP